tara:strand:+ start:1484 stop:1846 length:363 start_codon:yes stop_codon:yes gene_type:complete
MNNSLKIISIIVLLVGLGTFLMIVMISSFFQDSSAEIEKESLNIEFSGVVESISYSEKGYPSAFINKQYIYIPAANNDKLKIEDSIVKNQGKNIVYQFRNEELIDSLEGPVIIDSVVMAK